MPFSTSIPGPKGDTGAAGNGASTDTYDKLYVTNNGAGTNVKIGDDAWIGDVNVANHISIKGFEDASKGGIILGNGLSEKISSNGTDMTLIAENDILLNAGSSYTYLGSISPENRVARVTHYGSFFDTLQQTCTANSIQPMLLRTTDFALDVSIASNSRITMTYAGKYNIAFSAQFRQPNGSGVVNIWLAKNGTAVANSNTKLDINANNPYSVAAWNFFVDAAAGDYYQIMWSSDDARTVIETVASTGSGATLHPAVPSVIATVNQIG